MSETLDHAISRLTDGEDVDWESLLAGAVDDRQRALIEDLRAIARFDTADFALGSSANAAADLTVGVSPSFSATAPRRWAHLGLFEEIGRGAHGVVYRAWDTRLAREVAVKLMADDAAGQHSLEEARRLARVSHQHVVAVHGADRVDGLVGIWMELLKGRTLEALLHDHGPFSDREVAALAFDICGAVAAVHGAGLIHRDIKAQNIMREPGGRLVLMDVGASTSVDDLDTPVATLAGTPLYMAPELFAGGSPGVASDIYAMGVLLYCLVTGSFPVDARTLGDVRRAHAETRLTRLRDVRADLRPGFVRVVEQCLARDPGERFASVAELEHALQQIDVVDGARRSWPRRRVLSLVAVAALASALGGAALHSWYARRAVGEPVPRLALAITPEQYTLFAGYEELAFEGRLSQPAKAASATRGALAQVRPSLPGQHPIFALLYARLVDSWRRAGDLTQARAEQLDGEAHVIGSVGEDHPYTAVLAMEAARNALASGDHAGVAAGVLRALNIRWRVLGLTGGSDSRTPLLDRNALERASRAGARLEDTDGDGLFDLVESTLGLNPRLADSDGNGVNDSDEDHDADGIPNGLALGLLSDPFLTWAQYGAHDPRRLGWQAPTRFPTADHPERSTRPPAWRVTAEQSLALFTQRLAPAHSTRAMSRGFSLFTRLQPIHGIAAVALDSAPIGPRFDILVRRIDKESIEIRLASKVVPREGPTVVVTAPENGRAPLLELRYAPAQASATLFVDGRRVLGRYTDHSQYQDVRLNEGAVSWGLTVFGEGAPQPEALFGLVWLEIR